MTDYDEKMYNLQRDFNDKMFRMQESMNSFYKWWLGSIVVITTVILLVLKLF